ncbi:MAG: glycerol kinase GlpK [Saprospiraceae bacterium]|nr:glycerol kinase GlpK [Saprospiraceae bacterium]
MDKYVLALDQGTTSSRAVLVNRLGEIVGQAQQEFTQYFPQPGWVEHDAMEIWQSQQAVIARLLQDHSVAKDQLVALGITNQRETTIVWDRATGRPIHPAIVWQDRRTAGYCDNLRAQGHGAMIQEKTGLVLDAYFSGTKLKWVLDHVDGARQRAEDGELAFGTVDTWLMWNLSNGAIHATDVTNASRTLLFNIHTLEWDNDLLALLDISKALLPQVKSCSESYGTCRIDEVEGLEITGVAGDQQAALFGQLCTEPGMVKNTYGTGCFIMANTGETAIASKNNLLTTIGWQLNGKTTYAMEGSVFIAGAIVQWLRDGLGIISDSADVEALAAEVESNEGVYLVPALAGLGAPHWDQYARGTIIGLTRGSTKAHIARAALESIAYQTYDVVKAMEADSGIQLKELKVDGGATANKLLMRFQADILNMDVKKPQFAETTVLGAAYFAGLAVGFWEDLEALKTQFKIAESYHPTMEAARRKALVHTWHEAVERAKNWEPKA